MVLNKLLLLVIVLFSITACASKQIVERTVYQDVYIPVKCDVTKPIRPVFVNDVVLSTLDLIDYALKLEATLDICIKNNEVMK